MDSFGGISRIYFFQENFLENFEYFSEIIVEFGKDPHQHPFYLFHKSYANASISVLFWEYFQAFSYSKYSIKLLDIHKHIQ